MGKEFFNEEGALSKFNEGALQMIRIHELQRRIHDIRSNPLILYPEENLYGYQIIFSSLQGLFSEVSSKLTEKELANGESIRKGIIDFIDEHPPHINQPNEVSHQKNVLVNTTSWKILKEALWRYEIIIRKYLEKHDLTSPTIDDSGL